MHHTSDRLRTSSCSIFKYRDKVVGSSGPVHLTEDFCFISPRDGNFAPPRLTRPSPASPCMGFTRPIKVMGQDFSPAPQGGTGMDLDFLDPPYLAPVAKGYNCKFFIL